MERIRIEAIDVAAFGALAARRIEFDPRAPTVVLGRNEAGKSSLQEALRTLLFGFRPAKLASHPYRPRGGADRLELVQDLLRA